MVSLGIKCKVAFSLRPTFATSVRTLLNVSVCCGPKKRKYLFSNVMKVYWRTVINTQSLVTLCHGQTTALGSHDYNKSYSNSIGSICCYPQFGVGVWAWVAIVLLWLMTLVIIQCTDETRNLLTTAFFYCGSSDIVKNIFLCFSVTCSMFSF